MLAVQTFHGIKLKEYILRGGILLPFPQSKQVMRKWIGNPLYVKIFEKSPETKLSGSHPHFGSKRFVFLSKRDALKARALVEFHTSSAKPHKTQQLSHTKYKEATSTNTKTLPGDTRGYKEMFFGDLKYLRASKPGSNQKSSEHLSAPEALSCAKYMAPWPPSPSFRRIR